MNNTNRRISSISKLEEISESGIICLTDLNKKDKIRNCYVTRNESFIEFHFGEDKLFEFKLAYNSKQEEQLVFFDILNKRPLISIPTLFQGLVNKVCTFNEISIENECELDFNENQFIGINGLNAELITELNGNNFKFVFKVLGGKKCFIEQVDKFGKNSLSEQVIFNKSNNKNTQEGYIIFDKKLDPLFVCKEHLSENDKNKNVVYPCLSYREDTGKLIDIVVLANKIKGEE